MSRFIELTDYSDQTLMVNVDNIIYFRPYTGADEVEDGTVIYFTVQGDNTPVNVYVKDDYAQIAKLIMK